MLHTDLSPPPPAPLSTPSGQLFRRVGQGLEGLGLGFRVYVYLCVCICIYILYTHRHTQTRRHTHTHYIHTNISLPFVYPLSIFSPLPPSSFFSPLPNSVDGHQVVGAQRARTRLHLCIHTQGAVKRATFARVPT